MMTLQYRQAQLLTDLDEDAYAHASKILRPLHNSLTISLMPLNPSEEQMHFLSSFLLPSSGTASFASLDDIVYLVDETRGNDQYRP